MKLYINKEHKARRFSSSLYPQLAALELDPDLGDNPPPHPSVWHNKEQIQEELLLRDAQDGIAVAKLDIGNVNVQRTHQTGDGRGLSKRKGHPLTSQTNVRSKEGTASHPHVYVEHTKIQPIESTNNRHVTALTYVQYASKHSRTTHNIRLIISDHNVVFLVDSEAAHSVLGVFRTHNKYKEIMCTLLVH